MGKLSVFILLLILVAISWGQIENDSLAEKSSSQELNVNVAVSENGKVEAASIAGDGEPVTIEQQTTTENESTENADEVEAKSTTVDGEPVTIEQQITTENESTENVDEVEVRSTTVDGEPVTIEQQTTTENKPTENTDEGEAKTTTVDGEPETAETKPTTTLPAPVCSTLGTQAHESDCRQYYECSLEGSQDGSFHLITKSCPEKQAFSAKLNRCSRDISSCSLDIQCVNKGCIADPASNNSYYYCQNYYIGEGFHIFHIDCESYEIYFPSICKCCMDLNRPIVSRPLWGTIKDVDIVNMDLKVLKEEYKQQLKEMKEQTKAEKKLQKQKAKEAKNQAKMEEKLKKEKVKQEEDSFVCAKEGNFASQVADNRYIACIGETGKFKAVSVQCISGTSFNSETGTCVNINSAND